jgi:tetratricopeptide (TPR) repeat protein
MLASATSKSFSGLTGQMAFQPDRACVKMFAPKNFGSKVMKRLLAAFGCAVLLLCFDAAAAPQDLEWSACNNSQDHDVSISGCTRIIDRGNREPVAGRALAYRNRADAYYRKGDADHAMRDADEAIRLDPKLASAYNTRGHTYLSKNDYDRAIQDYSEAIRLNPKFANFYINRGSVYYVKGDAEEAIRDADEAIRLDPNHPLGYDLRGNAYLQRHEYDRAIQDYDAAIGLDPIDARAYSGRGAAYREKGDLARAMIELDASIRFNPNLARAYFHRGLLFQRNGDGERAMADLHRALELEKNEAYAREVRNALANIATESRAKVSTPPPLIAERRVALVVGNSAYTAVPALPNPERDAQAIAAALRSIGFQTVMLETNTTRERLVAALRAFEDEVEKADWAVIYYAGHGIEIGGVNYLVPVDAKLTADRDVQDEAVPLDRALSAIGEAKKLRLVVVDACRDNPFIQQMRRTVASRSIGRGLASIEPEGGTLVAYAAKHGQTALDGDGQNSPFATALLAHLAQPNIEINKLFRIVRDDVLEATGRRQEPFVYGSLPGQDFYFVAR